MSLTVTRTRTELAAARDALTGPVAVVMTMGALHAGHAELIRQARRRAASVLVTVFLNPLQFGPGEDLARYPRTLDEDLALAAEHGADVVFAPGPDVVYPDGDPGVRVAAGPLGEVLEGASRPGHFDGVLTVVAKMFHLTRADLAFFGQKDAQQLLLVRRMVRDLDLGVEVVAVPTVREADGLAMSSRNRYLTPFDREVALVLQRALRAGAAAAPEGPRPCGAPRATSWWPSPPPASTTSRWSTRTTWRTSASTTGARRCWPSPRRSAPRASSTTCPSSWADRTTDRTNLEG